MKYRILLLSVLMLIITGCESKSHIIFEDTTHNFGKVRPDSTVSYTFNFKNAGTDTLVIEKIKTG